MGAVRLRYVLGDGREAARMVLAPVSCDALPTTEDLDRGGRITQFHRLADQCVGNGVAVPFELDVVVDVDLRLLPLCALEALRGQRLQGRLVDQLEALSPARCSWRIESLRFFAQRR